jgi:Patatin-like phospholipase
MTHSTATNHSYSCARDYQLFGPGPKRVLALDGGGVRGAITVAFLERIEALLSQHHGRRVRLGDYFHLIGGTSTGSIIAGALALGRSAAEVRRFYTELAPRAFKRQRWSIPVLHSKFEARGLRREIENVVGDLELRSDALVTGLCIVTKRIDTGSPWIVANNPEAPFWHDRPDSDGNKHYKLATLVRASTAAPHFFDPEVFPIKRGTPELPPMAAAPLRQPGWQAEGVRERLQNRLRKSNNERRTTTRPSRSYKWSRSSRSGCVGRSDPRAFPSSRSVPAPTGPSLIIKTWASPVSLNWRSVPCCP